MFLDHNKGSANFNSDGRVLSLLEESQQQGERRKYLESYRAHRGLDAVDIRLAPGIPWESLDYYSRMAAKHSVGLVCFLVPIIQLSMLPRIGRNRKGRFSY